MVKYLYTFLFSGLIFKNGKRLTSSKMVTLKDYSSFYKLAKKRAKSHKEYIKFENFQSTLVMKFLQEKQISLKEKKVLDLGCGRGGYSLKFRKEGAKVTALDITREYFQNVSGVNFVLGDATKMPFKQKSFDFVFCSSLIEHIKYPRLLVSEIKRVLKEDGICYLSFPPFWSPVGAHQFKPFHYLGEKIAIKLARKFYHVRSFRYDDVYGKLYIRRIGQVKRIIKDNKLKIKSISTRMLPINFARIPLLNEFLTWHVEFLLEK